MESAGTKLEYLRGCLGTRPDRKGGGQSELTGVTVPDLPRLRLKEEGGGGRRQIN